MPWRLLLRVANGLRLRAVSRALLDIENEMRQAAESLDDALFVEYWGRPVPPENRIAEWLKRADALAQGWRPSEHLFLGGS